MKTITSLLLGAAIAVGNLPVMAAADISNLSVIHGEYCTERIGTLGDKDSKGLLFFPEQELMYDFDGETIPQGVAAGGGGTIAVSNDYYATPCPGISKSLKWTTNGKNSLLTLDGDGVKLNKCLVPNAAGKTYDWRHLYYFGVALFQEQLTQDGEKRAFEITIKTDNAQFNPQYTIYLHRAGWNFFSKKWGRITNELPGRKVTEIKSISIKQISGAPGDIYVDDVLIYVCNAKNYTYTPYIENSAIPSGGDYPVAEPDAAETAGVLAIEKKVMPDLPKRAYIPENEMKAFQDYYNTWNIQESGSFVNGENPLYYHRAAPGYTPLNDDSYFMNKRNAELSTQYKNICRAYNQVQNAAQKKELGEYVLGLSRLALTYGSLPEAWYGGRGFAEGAYYAKDLLEKAGLAGQMADQIKTQYGTDSLLYAEHVWENPPLTGWRTTADDLHTGYQSLMVSILLENDMSKKVRDLYRLKSYLEHVLLTYAPNDTGTLKPDGSMFHHNMHKYDYGWRDAGNSGMVTYVQWLAGTPFRVSEQTLERLNHIADVKYQIIEKSARVGTPDQLRYGLTSSGNRQLALAGMPDGSMEINPYRAAEWLAYNDIDSNQWNKELKEKFLKMGIKPAAPAQANTTLSYAAVNVHRRLDWKVQAYASSKRLCHNEYLRPATLFYNIAGLALTTENDHPAMLTDKNDNIYGRSNIFEPASGYNFSRAPGVTAPDIDALQLTSPGSQKGSSDFVGGVSTKNGNGVFTVSFDANDNRTVYQNTPAKDFRFKKSYFCFDDMVVSLASNIGYGGAKPVTTGLFQEKMTANDQIVMAGKGMADYHAEYNSDDNPWLIDTVKKGGIYLFPGQKYTVTRGEQTFLYKAADNNFNGKGNYTSAYIKHSPESVAKNAGKYAYILIPQPTEERMAGVAASMKSNHPEIEIIQQDEHAHVVKNNRLDSTGYVFFDTSAVLEDQVINKVNSPVVMMTKEWENGSGLSIAIADPDLRMEKTDENPLGWSMPKDITVTLKGSWKLKETAEYQGREYDSNIRLEQKDGNSELTITCKDGLTSEFLLENAYNNLSSASEQKITVKKDSELTLWELADAINAGMSDVFVENGVHRINCYYRNRKITFTENSRIATIDRNIVILEKNARIENGEFIVAESVLGDILNSEPLVIGDEVIYTQTDAGWREWDVPPQVQEGFIFKGGSGGKKPEIGVNTLTVPEDIKEGTFIFAVYKNGGLKNVEISDLSKTAANRAFAYKIADGQNAEDYLFKGFIFGNMTSIQPDLRRAIYVN